MANNSAPSPKLDRYVVIHVATTCDEHGVYVTKDSAEVIEIGWILLDTKTCDEVRKDVLLRRHSFVLMAFLSCIGRAFSSNQSTHPSLPYAVSFRIWLPTEGFSF